MVTKTDICNFALAKIGNKKVVSIDNPQTREEKSCNLWYDITRQVALRTGLFNFAIKRDILALPAEHTPAFGWTYQYKLPNDCIKFLGIGDPTQKYDYDVEDGYIMLDDDFDGALPIRYIYDCTDTTKFDPLFIKYLVTLLAVELAGDINKDINLRNAMEELSEMYKSMAQSVASGETQIIKISRSKFLSSKFGYVKESIKK